MIYCTRKKETTYSALLWTGLIEDVPEVLRTFDDVRYVREEDDHINGLNPIYVQETTYDGPTEELRIGPGDYIVFDDDFNVEVYENDVFKELFDVV